MIKNKNYFLKKKILLIAEIGVNHNGNLATAKKLIFAASKAGADFVKIQSFKAKEIVSHDAPKLTYQLKNTGKNESQQAMLKKLELSFNQQKKLFNYAKKRKINLISTPYDKKSAMFLHQLGVKFFKTASADLTDQPLHVFLAKLKRPVLVSVGMASLQEISSTLKIYKKYKNNHVAILHCVANYPCSIESLNLSVITKLKKMFKIPVGFSDHSDSFLPPIIARTLGSKIFEKHFTLNKNARGPDHQASFNPSDFHNLKKLLEITEIAMGKPIKKCQPEEREMKKNARKSIYLLKDVKKNQVIKSHHITLRRPGLGLLGDSYFRVCGKIATKNLSSGKLLLKKDFA
jgi:N,N'-diacetyllegionaminate synthase